SLMPMNELPRAAAYSRGGSSTNSTRSGSRWNAGTPGTRETTTAAPMVSSGAENLILLAMPLRTITPTPMATTASRTVTAGDSPSVTASFARPPRWPLLVERPHALDAVGGARRVAPDADLELQSCGEVGLEAATHRALGGAHADRRVPRYPLGKP